MDLIHFFPSSFAAVIPSQYSYSGYSSWIDLSIITSFQYVIEQLEWCCLFQYTMPTFQCPWFFSFPLIITIIIFVGFERFIFVFQVLFFCEGHQILYVSIFSIKLFLQCLIYCPFFIPSLLLSWSAASGKIASRARVKLFGVRIGWSILFSIFSSIRLIFQHLVRLLLTQPMSPVLSQ